MSELISRQAVLDAICISTTDPATIAAVQALPVVVPQVVVNISGGLNQGASATHKVDVYTLDFDVDSFDDDSTGIVVEGDNAYFGQSSADVDPDWVKEVLEAPTIFFSTGDRVCTECDGEGVQHLPPDFTKTDVCAECKGTGTAKEPE